MLLRGKKKNSSATSEFDHYSPHMIQNFIGEILQTPLCRLCCMPPAVVEPTSDIDVQACEWVM